MRSASWRWEQERRHECREPLSSLTPSDHEFLPQASRKLGCSGRLACSSPISGQSELDPLGRVAYLGRALGCLMLGVAWGALAWIAFSSSLGCSYTDSHTSCSIDKSRKWVATQPAEAQIGGERLLLSVHLQDGMRRLWVVCEEGKTREGPPKPMPNLSPTFILNFIFVPIFKKLFPPNFKSFFP